MTFWECIQLFRSILSPAQTINAERIERMGVLAVKIAQMYAVRSDLLSAEKCAELSKLMQRATTLTAAQFDERWKKVAPANFIAAVETLATEPIAAASLGQVHRARLRGGAEVVIKLSKRDVHDEFTRDLRRMRQLLRGAVFVYPKLKRLADPLAALEAVERQTLLELDFTAEAAGAQRLSALARESSDRLHYLAHLKFPRYLDQFSTSRFLVSEFIEGETIAQHLDRGSLPYEALLELFHIHGYFLFVRGEFHGDLHPGNVIWKDNKFWFLDNANIETVPRKFARALFEMLVLLGEGCAAEAATKLAGISIDPLPPVALKNFQTAFVELYRGFSGKSVAQISLTNQMMRTVRLAVEHDITFPRGAFPLIKSLMYLDGMALRAAPRANLLKDVARFAGDFPTIEINTG